ncbi:MAG: DUF2279 domain-containing protein [Chitinophagaceae bacterium]
MYSKVVKVFIINLLLITNLICKAQAVNHKSSIYQPVGIYALVKESPQKHLKDSISSLNNKRVVIIGATNISIWAASFVILNKTWYSKYPRSAFHFYNDMPEWKKMDKIGHLWTNYHVTRLSVEMWRWTGLPDKKSLILGGISGVAYQSIIEIQDGFSAEWGFSWPDMTSNILGAAVFVAQELQWHQQRVQIKMGYWPYKYPSDMTGRRNELFGSSQQERILKDYNSQTYWASTSLAGLFPSAHFPAWLSVSVGYGADGMYGGTVNRWKDKMGNPQNRTDIKRTRHFYLAPDIDLTRIKTKSKLLGTVFYVVNMIKVPAPAIELSSKGSLKFHYLKF